MVDMPQLSITEMAGVEITQCTRNETTGLLDKKDVDEQSQIRHSKDMAGVEDCTKQFKLSSLVRRVTIEDDASLLVSCDSINDLEFSAKLLDKASFTIMTDPTPNTLNRVNVKMSNTAVFNAGGHLIRKCIIEMLNISLSKCASARPTFSKDFRGNKRGKGGFGLGKDPGGAY